MKCSQVFGDEHSNKQVRVVWYIQIYGNESKRVETMTAHSRL